MTPPNFIQRLFHRYRADQLDIDQHAALIVQIVLEMGQIEDWQWLFATYGWDAICDWVADPTHVAAMSPREQWFWTGVLLGVPRIIPRWANRCPRRPVPEEDLPDWIRLPANWEPFPE